jgi:mono/diheme cytochrome c family protein
MRQIMTCIFSCALVAVAIGCGGEEAAPLDDAAARQAARADSVEMAEAQYDPAAFDTISWATEAELYERGGVVFAYSCAKCHGSDGAGGGELAVQHELEMPSLIVEDWQYAGDIPKIRHRIYVGHESEMPSWGLYGLKYRDIDAVARYIDEIIRAPDSSMP